MAERLGELLVAKGVVDAKKLAGVLERQQDVAAAPTLQPAPLPTLQYLPALRPRSLGLCHETRDWSRAATVRDWVGYTPGP